MFLAKNYLFILSTCTYGINVCTVLKKGKMVLHFYV